MIDFTVESATLEEDVPVYTSVGHADSRKRFALDEQREDKHEKSSYRSIQEEKDSSSRKRERKRKRERERENIFDQNIPGVFQTRLARRAPPSLNRKRRAREFHGASVHFSPCFFFPFPFFLSSFSTPILNKT